MAGQGHGCSCPPHSCSIQFQETKNLLGQTDSINAEHLTKLDTAGDAETFNKIVNVFGDKTDAGVGLISMEKMKHVMDRLDTGHNVFYYIMNTISVLGGTSGINQEEKKEREDELNLLADYSPENGEKAPKTISLLQYQTYVAKQIQRETTVDEENKQMEMGKTVRRRRPMQDKKNKPNTRPGQKLLKYFKAIGEAKKINFKPTNTMIPLMALVLLIFYRIQTPELTDLFMFKTKQSGELWRYFTYSLLHDDSEHFFMNLIVFLPVGWGLEVVHGTFWVSILYFIGVVSSAMAFYVFDEGSLVGCSGGVFCLVAASLSTCIMNWKEDKAVLIKVWKKKTPIAYAGGMSRNMKVTGIMVFALASCTQLEDAGVSVLAHIFGALTGFLTGFTLLKDEKEERWKRAWKPFCLCVFSVAFGMALAFNIAEYRDAVKMFSFKEPLNSRRL